MEYCLLDNSDQNKFFSDEDGKNEITQESTILKATGHKWNEEYTVDQKATKTTKGKNLFIAQTLL